MRKLIQASFTAVILAAFAYSTLAFADGSHNGWKSAQEFDDLSIIVEQNATDGDTEIVILAKPDSDNGLTRFVVRSPDRRKVVNVTSPRRVLGMREFRFESPEPAGEAILASYPAGTYTFLGIDSEGQKFKGTGELTHDLPSPITILWPMPGHAVPSDALTIQWSQAADAVGVILEFENESADPEQSFTVNFPAGVTSFDVPASLLVPGADYQVGVAAIGDSGNTVFTEVEFSTAE